MLQIANKKYSKEFKEKIDRLILEEGITLAIILKEYNCCILDLYNRSVMASKISTNITSDLAIELVGTLLFKLIILSW